MESSILKQLGAENYTVKQVDLLKSSGELNEDGILAVISPRRDISKEESSKIQSFLNNGGKAAFFMDITREYMPNFQELFSNYGVKLQNSLLVENNPENVANQPVDLLPVMEAHDIINPLKSSNMPVYMPVSQGIYELKNKRDSLKVEKLLITSNNSYAKVNLDSSTITKESGDIQGPIDVAVAITNEDKDPEKSAKIVLVGSASFLDDNVSSQTRGTNVDFTMNSFNWLQGKKDSIIIRPKNLSSLNLTMNSMQKLVLSGVVVIFIPGIITIIGIAVWLKRRYK